MTLWMNRCYLVSHHHLWHLWMNRFQLFGDPHIYKYIIHPKKIGCGFHIFKMSSPFLWAASLHLLSASSAVPDCETKGWRPFKCMNGEELGASNSTRHRQGETKWISVRLGFLELKHEYHDWLVVYLTLWKIWVRRLGLWHSQLNGKS